MMVLILSSDVMMSIMTMDKAAVTDAAADY